MVIALVRVTDPSSYGIASVSGDDLIDIVEKPDLGSAPTNLAFAGVGIFNESIFSALEATRLSSRGEFEITDSIKAMLSRGYSVKCSILSVEEWLDVGRPWDLLEANERLLKSITSQVEGEVDESVSLEGSVVVSKKARIRRGSVIEGPVWIGESSEIGPYAHIRAYSTIGRRVHVGNFCEVKNSIVMDGSRIPHLSYIGDSIIGERCNLGAGTITANLRLDEKPIRMLVKGELIETGLRKLGVIMGDDVKTGINVSIMPGVKIRSGAFVAAGEVVARDIERA
jgi:bifunctional UDP-N-acetylglucosamine pyrophosphorylase/glucosamine-1-phosphate N-acetyltransferase